MTTLFYNPETKVIFESDDAQDAAIQTITADEVPDLIANGSTVDSSAAGWDAGNVDSTSAAVPSAESAGVVSEPLTSPSGLASPDTPSSSDTSGVLDDSGNAAPAAVDQDVSATGSDTADTSTIGTVSEVTPGLTDETLAAAQDNISPEVIASGAETAVTSAPAIISKDEGTGIETTVPAEDPADATLQTTVVVPVPDATSPPEKQEQSELSPHEFYLGEIIRVLERDFNIFTGELSQIITSAKQHL